MWLYHLLMFLTISLKLFWYVRHCFINNISLISLMTMNILLNYEVFWAKNCRNVVAVNDISTSQMPNCFVILNSFYSSFSFFNCSWRRCLSILVLEAISKSQANHVYWTLPGNIHPLCQTELNHPYFYRVWIFI